mgnify:CR=1 FL=1
MIPRWLTDNLVQVAERLRPLEIDYAFLCGCIVPLLLDDPDLMPMRPTNDVDVVILLIRQSKMAEIEEKLRRRGFVHADFDGAPICRWRLGEADIRFIDSLAGNLPSDAASQARLPGLLERLRVYSEAFLPNQNKPAACLALLKNISYGYHPLTR